MLETYISGAHIQVDQWQSYACNMIVAYGGHCDYGIWGSGYCMESPPVGFKNHSFSCPSVVYATNYILSKYSS